ncbi:transcription factor Pcc1-domain-containing protein [Flagelloscypha sp. PMI_526]|nr:transcription factor Pcc1-domain-containing protein [Flagelloscypha sp. PMI_526]
MRQRLQPAAELCAYFPPSAHDNYSRTRLAHSVRQFSPFCRLLISTPTFFRTIRAPFSASHDASIAKRSIEVDRELQPQAVKRTLSIEGDELVATFHTLTVRLARLSINSFLENVELISRTLGEFGDDPGTF